MSDAAKATHRDAAEKPRAKNGELWRCVEIINVVLDEDTGLVLSIHREQSKLLKLFKPCPRCEKIA